MVISKSIFETTNKKTVVINADDVYKELSYLSQGISTLIAEVKELNDRLIKLEERHVDCTQGTLGSEGATL